MQLNWHKKEKDYLSVKVLELIKDEPRGEILEAGCGQGRICSKLKEMGFKVVASDLDKERFKYQQTIDFVQADLNAALPWEKNTFQGIAALEVIEHLDDFQFLLKEFNAILKTNGFLIISVPNILNLHSRIRFLFEGSFNYYREPPLDKYLSASGRELDIHTAIFRYQELEYFLARNGFTIEKIASSVFESYALLLSGLAGLMCVQNYLKQLRGQKDKNYSYSRINRIMLSRDLLFGRHLIIKARKGKL